MELIRMTTESNPHFEAAFSLYESAFPSNERRTRSDQLRAMENRAFFACAAVEKNEVLAAVFYWQTEAFTYLENFAVRPDLRGSGIGTEILNKLLSGTQPLILEIEPPVDAVTIRRKHFYERLGLQLHSFPHLQYPYQLGGDPAPLCIMAKPAITQTQYDAFFAWLKDVVLFYTEYEKRPV